MTYADEQFSLVDECNCTAVSKNILFSPLNLIEFAPIPIIFYPFTLLYPATIAQKSLFSSLFPEQYKSFSLSFALHAPDASPDAALGNSPRGVCTSGSRIAIAVNEVLTVSQRE